MDCSICNQGFYRGELITETQYGKAHWRCLQHRNETEAATILVAFLREGLLSVALGQNAWLPLKSHAEG